MTAPDLGPLPEPTETQVKCSDGKYLPLLTGPLYTASDMRAYALQERARMAEACAKLAQSFVWFDHDNCSPDDGPQFIASAIRAMAASTEGEK